MDAGGHWEETILARLEHGFSSLGGQFADLKCSIVNQQAESAGLRHEIRTLRCVLEEKGPLLGHHENAVPKEEGNGPSADEADSGASRSRSIYFAEAPQAEAVTFATGASTSAAASDGAGSGLQDTLPTPAVQLMPLPDSDMSTTPGAPDKIVLQKMQTMQVAMDESGQKTKYFKLRDIWDADDMALQRLSADNSDKTATPQNDLTRLGYHSASRMTPTENLADSAAKIPKFFSALWAPKLTKDQKNPREASPCALHPHSIPRLLWDLGGVLLLCYDFALIPLQTFDLPNLIILRVFHWTTRLYWSLDIIASFMTGYYQDGKLEMRLWRIAVRYGSRWLLLDIIIVLPEWIAMVFADEQGTGRSLGAQGLLRGVRGVRFLRLLRLAKVQRMVYLVEARVNSSYMLLCLGILRLLAGLIMVIHFFACAWYWIGQTSESGWVYVTGMDKQDFTERYVSCFQWSLHQFHPASRKEMIEGTLAERAFVLVCALTGLAISSVFVSSITNTMLQLQSLQEERTKQLRAVREFVLEHAISLELALRAKKYVRARLEDALRRKYENELLELLPESLLSDLHEEARLPVVAHHHFFNVLRTDFPRTVRRLCHEAMAEMAAHPGDVVFHSGDVCKRFFFIERGDLRYYPNADVREDTGDAGDEGTFGIEDDYQELLETNRPQESSAELKEREKSSSSAGSLRQSRSLVSNKQKAVPVHANSYLSEATLWTYWEHRGALKAKANSGLLTVNAAKFPTIIKDTAFAFIDAAVYAKKFVQRLNEDPLFRSDLILPGGYNTSSLISSTMALKSWRMQFQSQLTKAFTRSFSSSQASQAWAGKDKEQEQAPKSVVTVQQEPRNQDIEKAHAENFEDCRAEAVKARSASPLSL